MYYFQKKLAFSKSSRLIGRDTEAIRAMLDGCLTVTENTDKTLDLKGVDYIATLRKGAKVYIDAKTREPGCSKWWNNGPEVAIEKWSVVPNGTRGKIGWSLDESKISDLVLFLWDKSDCSDMYMLPFQLLRVATRRNLLQWYNDYKVDIQTSDYWQSECVFVPIDIVIREVTKAMKLKRRI